ncbi:MAG TPA: MFS transporter [Steroidobacteraceae bacterium]
MHPPLPFNVRRLLAARAARSLGQGATIASFSLYLEALGFKGTAIGAVLMAGLLFGALLTLVVGPLSDRTSRRALLLGYEVAAALAALAAMLAPNLGVLIAAATVAGFGRGANGAAGPFSPVEQAWLAREVAGEARSRAFSLNATLAFMGMAAGAALVALPAVLGVGFHDLSSYRMLFALPLAGSVVALILIAQTRVTDAAPPPEASRATPSAAQVTLAENRLLRRLAAVSALNGLAIGIVSPLIAYWFLRRFHESPAAIGPALALSFVLASAGSVLGGRLSRRLGAVRSVVWMRLIGLALLVAVPFSPTFLIAAGLYALRSAFNRGTTGARQLVAAGLTRAERRGLAASVQSLSSQLPRAAGPVLGGWLIHRGDFVAPFLLTAVMQALYLLLYRQFFGGASTEAA